ncbi:MAG TPA: metallophosphoesterase [Gaiellaceae bacterium]
MKIPFRPKTLRAAAARVGGGTLAAGAALGGWSLFESQWVELRELDVPVPGLHRDLEGFRILHLSDFHLGTVSLNGRAVRKAVRWAGGRFYDMAAVTGDLLSRRRGTTALRDALAGLDPRLGSYLVLGNHDIAETRDPFSEPADPGALVGAGGVLLSDDSRIVEAGGARVQIAGCSPETFRAGLSPARLADPDADLRILLCHFPDVVRRLRPGAFDLVLAGHLHGGQICLPAPGGKLRLEHLRAAHWEGLHETQGGLLHVSRGLGTSFVPFRLLARPEATMLTLRRG